MDMRKQKEKTKRENKREIKKKRRFYTPTDVSSEE